jgi:chromosomal replication initiator protein
MGKTHLVNAIGNHTKDMNPGTRIKYIQASDFARILHDAFSNQSGEVIDKVEQIKDEYEKYDMLIVDDVQFLEGKVKTSEVFFYIFNTFLMNDKQVIITSDKYPEELKDFEARLMTRFMNGVTLPIAPPDVVTAKEIIRKKLIEVHLQEKDFLSEAALEFMAQNFSTNVRELESSLNTVIMHSISYDKENMDLSDVEEIFKGLVKKGKKGVTINSIISTVAKYYKVKASDIKGKSRSKEIVMARHISIYLIRTLLDESLINIAKEFGRDHTTIMASVKKISKLNESDVKYSKAIHELIRTITK